MRKLQIIIMLLLLSVNVYSLDNESFLINGGDELTDEYVEEAKQYWDRTMVIINYYKQETNKDSYLVLGNDPKMKFEKTSGRNQCVFKVLINGEWIVLVSSLKVYDSEIHGHTYFYDIFLEELWLKKFTDIYNKAYINKLNRQHAEEERKRIETNRMTKLLKKAFGR